VLVLAIDTSSSAVIAAVVEVSGRGESGARVQMVAERSTINPRGHSELLAPAISACLAEAGVGPSDLRAVVAGLGPGPFTGLRVGLVTAAAIADALAVPTYGVCSLDAIAPSAGTVAEIGEIGELIVATDARRKEVYWARYDEAGARVDGPHVSRPTEVPPAGARRMAGAGARLYAAELGLTLTGADYPSALDLVAHAAARIRSGADSEPLSPLYLRRPDAVPPASVKVVSQ
jgi:tRNA threonylcarbamoyl adenosine modification protein YeaZ